MKKIFLIFCVIVTISHVVNAKSKSKESSGEKKDRQKKEMSSSLVETFTACAGGDSSSIKKAKDKQKNKMKEIGMKTFASDAYFESMSQCSSAMNKQNIINKTGLVNAFMDKFFASLDVLITSQPGFDRFLLDDKKKKNKKYKKFYEAYWGQKEYFRKCRKNTKKAQNCFNVQSAEICATVITTCYEVSIQISTIA